MKEQNAIRESIPKIRGRMRVENSILGTGSASVVTQREEKAWLVGRTKRSVSILHRKCDWWDGKNKWEEMSLVMLIHTFPHRSFNRELEF